MDGFADSKMDVVCVEKGGYVRAGGGKVRVYREERLLLLHCAYDAVKEVIFRFCVLASIFSPFSSTLIGGSYHPGIIQQRDPLFMNQQK